MRIKPAYFYLILTIFLWSATPAVAKLALSELDNYQLLFYTSITSVISLFFINLFQGKLVLFLAYKPIDYMKMLGMSVLGIFLYYSFVYKAISLAPAGQVNVINYLWPIFIIIFSIPILKEKYNYKTILGISLSFLGALTVFTKGDLLNINNQYSTGYLFAAFGAVFYGLFSVIGKKLEYDKYSCIFAYYIMATILIVPASLLISGFVIPKSLTTILSIIVLGGLINSLSYVFWFKALKDGHTHKIANLVYITPFLAMIWTYFLNGEKFSVIIILGLALIITGIFIQLTNK